MNSDEDPATYAVLESSRFWVQKVLVPITVAIGVAGNIITVMVLTRRRMRSSTNTYLTALAIADIIHLFFVFLLSFKHYANIHDGKYAFYWRFHGLSYWLCDAASSTSIWLTVSFTVERYIAVCHPIKGKFFCTERRAKSMIVIIYIFCILTTASTTFEYQLSLNETCLDEGKSDLNITQKIGKLPHSGSNHNYTLDHTIIHNKSSSDNLLSYPILNDAYLSQLKKITLSNCTSNPCIVCILHILQPINMTKEKMTNTNLIENQVLASEATLIAMPEIKETIQENVLEKPPSEAEALTSSPDLNDNKTDITSDNTTCKKMYMIDVESTKLGQNQSYLTFMYWYSAIFFYLLPLALIATFNCFLVNAVYLSQRMRRTMTNSQESISLTNEKRITLMLIAVVVLFIICHTPTASLLIYKNFHKSKSAREDNIKLILGNFFNFLAEVNASLNFLLYCVLSKKFRSTFKQLFFERRKKRQDTIMLSSTKSKNSQKFNPYKTGLMRRNASEYHTPRNLETQSLTSIPRSKSLMVRPVGKAKSTDLVV